MPTQDHAPLQDIFFPESDHIAGAVFAGDGKTVLVHIAPAALNLWAAAVHYWPQVLGTIVGAAAVCLLFWIVRVLRSPRMPGEVYCRKCGYQVTCQTVCPECGVEVARKKPVRGKRTWVRLALPVALLAFVLAAYAGMWIARAPRDGAVACRWLWNWPWLSDKMAQRRWSWLNPFYVYVDRIVAVDLRTGEKGRVLCESGVSSTFPIRVSPDGAWLATVESDGKGWFTTGPIVLRNAETGGVVARLPIPDRCKGTGSHWTHVAGFENGKLYCVLCDWTDWTTELVEWEPGTGSTRTVIKEPAQNWTVNTGAKVAEGRFYELVNVGEVRFVSWSDFEQYMSDKGTTVRGFDRNGSRLWEHRVEYQFAEGNLACSSEPLAFISCMNEGVAGIDLRTGESTGLLQAPGHDGGWEYVAASPDGQLLFWSTVTSHRILVRDTRAQQWLEPLGNPAQVLNPVMSVSPDRRWLIGVGVTHSGSRTAPPRYISHLLIYDIDGIGRGSP